jgi:glutamine phosphoribosylpyrophosphate amidotransferase
MSTEEELFARRFPEALDELEQRAAAELEIESLTYIDVAGLDRVFAGDKCAACFTGTYPQVVSAEDRASIVADRKAG